MSSQNTKLAVADSIIDNVESLCSECGSPSRAVIIERDGKVYQRVECSCHEPSENLIFSDAELYRKLDDWNRLIFPESEFRAQPACACSNGAVDLKSTNEPSLAIIDITNRCNFRCPVCFAEAQEGEHYMLDMATVRKMLQALLDRPNPCRTVQFSGGEPTIHPEFHTILRMTRDMGFTHIQVATNGSRFVTPGYAKLCEEAGLHTIYLQFDGMSDEVFLKMRGQKLLDKKLAAVRAIEETNMRIVLVPTIISGVNVDQIGPIFRFALEHSRIVTGISIQPCAHVGRIQVDEDAEPFNLAAMAREFGQQTGLTRFAQDWFPLSAISLISRAVDRVRGGQSHPPMSDSHCSIGTFFYIDDNNQPHCLNSFFDMESFFRGMGEMKPMSEQGLLERQVSKLRQFNKLSSCLDRSKAPEGFTFERLMNSFDSYEDKKAGRSDGWEKRGFNGIFVAGMHFMDSYSYNLRRLHRCIIQYVSTEGELIPFCSYNAGARLRENEELVRLENLTGGDASK